MNRRCKTCGQKVLDRSDEELVGELEDEARACAIRDAVRASDPYESAISRLEIDWARRERESTRKMLLKLNNAGRIAVARVEGEQQARLLHGIRDISDDDLVGEVADEEYRVAIELGLKRLVDADVARRIADHPDAAKVLQWIQTKVMTNHDVVLRDDTGELRSRALSRRTEMLAAGVPERQIAGKIAVELGRKPDSIRKIFRQASEKRD